MIDFSTLTVMQIADGVKSKKWTAVEVLNYFTDNCQKYEDYNAIIEIYDDAIERAKEIDKKVEKGEKVGILAGVPVINKDNILFKNHKMSCASNFMKDFIAPYSATVIEKLENEDAVIFARANMDQFAMGSSNENSIYGPCKNACDPERVAGGSSGGSAVSVALNLAPIALGTDTGGSIRQPASFNGVVGVKPTYGTVSRYGAVAFASSTDQISPITKTIEENEFVLKVIKGSDCHDQTTIDNKMDFVKKDKYTIGVIKQLQDGINDSDSKKNFDNAIATFKNMGYEVIEVDIPHIEYSIPCYYILTPAEASSNLAKFDGLKYSTPSKEATDLDSLYVRSRSEGFGDEVKRRIILGNFVLSAGYFDAYYGKSKKVQSLIKLEFANAFKKCDAIITPTTPDTAFKIGEKINDPLSMYLEDIFTVPVSIAGIPAISVPYDTKNNLPLGLQFLGADMTESKLYEIAKLFTKSHKGVN